MGSEFAEWNTSWTTNGSSCSYQKQSMLFLQSFSSFLTTGFISKKRVNYSLFYSFLEIFGLAHLDYLIIRIQNIFLSFNLWYFLLFSMLSFLVKKKCKHLIKKCIDGLRSGKRPNASHNFFIEQKPQKNICGFSEFIYLNAG